MWNAYSVTLGCSTTDAVQCSDTTGASRLCGFQSSGRRKGLYDLATLRFNLH